MSQVAVNKITMLVASICIGLLLLILITGTVNADTEDKNDTIKSLIEMLKENLTSSPNFSMTFQFRMALIDGDSTWWSIPYKDTEADVERSLGQIGVDFVCFDERGGSEFVTRCSTFSNIVSITYSEQ